MRVALGPATDQSKAQKALTEALMKLPGKETLCAFLDAGLVLPENPRLLTQLLDTRDEELTRVVLRRLVELVEGGKKPSRMLLLQRLTAVEDWAEDGETRSLVEGLRARLDG